MTGVGVLAVGLLLCFAGVASLHLAVLASGFALGWLVAESLGGSVAVTAIAAGCAAVVAWVLSTLVFRAALLVVGGVAGGVIGAKLYGLLEGGDGNAVLAILFLLAVAVLTGLAAQRFHETALVWACAFGGAGLALSGLARIWPDTLGFLRTPDTTADAVIDAAAWIGLGAVGWSVQRRWLRRKAVTRSCADGGFRPRRGYAQVAQATVPRRCALTTVVLFHHAQGLTDGVRRFADRLSAAGHDVALPDLYEGATFATLDEGVAHAQRIGFDQVAERGLAAAADLPERSVYAGLSLGVLPAQRLAQTRPGALGALLLFSAVPAQYVGAWPAGVGLQLHLVEDDPIAEEDRPAAEELARTVDGAELHLYPGTGHLVVDDGLGEYDAAATALIVERSLAFLDRLG